MKWLKLLLPAATLAGLLVVLARSGGICR